MKRLHMTLVWPTIIVSILLTYGCDGAPQTQVDADVGASADVAAQRQATQMAAEDGELGEGQSPADDGPVPARAVAGGGGESMVADLNEQRIQEYVDWISQNGHTLDSAAMGTGFDDLDAFGEMVGDANIVGLGQAAYGSAELATMSHRLTEYLVSELGFDTVALPAAMPEAAALNEYVQSGDGDPEALIAGMGSNALNTRETLELVEWMREFNENSTDAVHLAGYRFSRPTAAIDNVLSFLQVVEPEYAPRAGEMYGQVDETWTLASDFVAAVVPLPAQDLVGKKIEVTAQGRTEGVHDSAGGATMMIQLNHADGTFLGQKEIYPDKKPRGTTPWTPQALSVQVPADAEDLLLVFYVPGRGSAWFDDLSIKADGVPVDVLPFAGDFESGDLSAFTVSERYPNNVNLDRSDFYAGAQSLRLDGPTGVGGRDVPLEEAVSSAEEVLEHLVGSRLDFVRELPEEDVDWAIQNARVVAQSLWRLSLDRPESKNVDLPTTTESLANNIAWLADLRADSRVVVLSNSSLVSRDARGVAQPLEDASDDEYLSVVLLTHSGMGRHIPGVATRWVRRFDGAVVEPDSWSVDLAELPDSSVETILARADAPMLLVDIREADEADRAARWLTDPRSIRHPWPLKLKCPHDYVEMDREHDLLVFVRDSTPTHPLDMPLPDVLP